MGFFSDWAKEINDREAEQGKVDGLAGRPADSSKTYSREYNENHRSWTTIGGIGRGSQPTSTDVGSASDRSTDTTSGGANWDWLALLPLIAGAIIGFVIGVPDGAFTALADTLIGVVGGVIALMIISFAVQMLEFLWYTKWIWLALALIAALGYFISGKL